MMSATENVLLRKTDCFGGQQYTVIKLHGQYIVDLYAKYFVVWEGGKYVFPISNYLLEIFVKCDPLTEKLHKIFHLFNPFWNQIQLIKIQ